MIEETQAEAPEIQEATEAVPATDETSTEAASETKEPPKPEDVAFPKKAENAISKRDRRIGRLTAERDALRRELATFKSRTPSEQPKEDSSANYGDYVLDNARWAAREEYANEQRRQAEGKLQSVEQQWVTERQQEALQEGHALKEVLPDLPAVMVQHDKILNSFSDEISQVFLEADNTVLAIYTLAKEGRLAEIGDMSPSRAAIEIGKAEMRGQALTKKPVTNAPAPIKGATGTGAGSKSLDNMSWSELRAWRNS